MDTLPPELFFLAIVALLLGGLTVWLVGYLGRGGRNRRARDPARSGDTQAELDASPADERELLRVSRTRGGVLAVFVQGRRYHRLREIVDPQVGQETMEALRAVLTFSEGVLPSTQWAATHAQRMPSPSPGTPSLTGQATLPQPSRPVGPHATDTPPASSGAPTLRRPGSMLDPLPLIDSIDKLVQQKVQERPDMAGRFVRLTTGPGGGLRIHVDQQVFKAVSDITDPQVRALIQEAIREWEGR